jgi:hypothetical protein
MRVSQLPSTGLPVPAELATFGCRVECLGPQQLVVLP